MRLLAPRPLAAAAVLAVLAAASPFADAARKPAPLPGWSLVGDYDLRFDPGFASLEGDYVFTLGGEAGSLQLAYGPKGTPVGGGAVGFTFFSAKVELSSDPGAANPITMTTSAFTFVGAVDPSNREDLVGTATYTPPGGSSPVAESLRLRRLRPLPPPATFRLHAPLTMDRRGFVTNGLGLDGKVFRGRLEVYGGKTLTGAVARGRVRTSAADGTTTALVKLTGKGWSVRLDGPVDADGFHAAADVRAAGFLLNDVAVTLPVQEGPKPPPPPPPPPPKNLVDRAVAHIVAGQVSLVRRGTPGRFFKTRTRGDIHVEFPTSAIAAPFRATPATAAAGSPIRFYVNFGSTAYGTAAAGGDVEITVTKFSTSVGQTIEVACKGTIVSASGRTKAVDVIVQGAVAP